MNDCKHPWGKTALAAIFFVAGNAFAAEPVWDGNKVQMVAEKLAPGITAYYPRDARELNAKGGAGATSSGLIVGTRGALLIDTMLNKRLNAQVLALVRKDTPLPLLYAVNTSAHGDHSYGNMYLSTGTRVIQSANTRDYINAHLADDKAFMIKNFGAGRGIEQISARTGDVLVPPGGKLSIDLGGKTVEIIDFGFAQTGGDLFVWEPQSKVMWTGNPIIANKPALPWLLDGHLVETLATLRKVYEFLPSDAKVVPGHGIPIGREELRWHIDYLAEVQKQVQAAIDQRLTLEQTVAQVKMPEYRGYVLFDWVHPSLNVPAAYKDLSAK
jgi:glyoxylase-like metal-dependent hydrolase (beta-lactamase superfamily II)